MAAKGNKLTPRCREAAVAEKVRLGDIVDIIGGGTPSKKREDFYRGAIPWATVRDMNCDIIKKTEFCITDEAVENSATNVIPKGEVVISTHVGLGKVCVLGQDTAINQDLKAIIPHQGVFRRYMYYWFCSQADILIRNGKGATVKGVTLDFVRALQIPLPALPTQRRIAAELDKICELKKNAETRLEKLDLLVKSRFVEMFGDYGANLNLEMSDLANRIKVAFVGTCAKYYTDSTNGVPMVRTTNITEHGLDLSDLKYVTHDFHRKNVKSQLHTGDLLIARFGSNGLSCLYSGGEANCLNAIIIEPNTAKVMPVFMLHLINSQYVQKQISNNLVGSTFAILNTKSLAKLRVCLPPLALQREFAAFVAKVDKLRLNVRETVSKMDMLYRLKLQECFG